MNVLALGKCTLQFLGVQEHYDCTYSQIVHKKIAIFVCLYVHEYIFGRGREGRERFGMTKHCGRTFTTRENLGEGKTEVLYTFLHPFQKCKITSKQIFLKYFK